MSDAKPPYRSPSVARPERKPRGVLVTRPGDPEGDAPPRPTARPITPPDPDAGVFSGLIAPHPVSTPSERWRQIALTLVGLPLIACTFLMVGWLDTRRVYGSLVQRAHDAPRPAGIAYPGAWVFGALPIVIVCFAHDVAWLGILGMLVPFAALTARRQLRKGIVDREAASALLRAKKRV